MCFMTWKRPTNPNFQLVRKKDGKIKIARIKTSVGFFKKKFSSC